MNHPLRPAFDMYMDKLQKQVAEVARTKQMLNDLALDMEIDSPFPDVRAEAVSGQPLRLDQFFQKLPATALTEYLEMRGQSKGAATWAEIWAAFNRGGFKSEDSEEDVKKTLKKNTTAFKYFSTNDAFGLKRWYSQDENNPQSSKKRGRPKRASGLVDTVSTVTEKPNETETPKQ